MNPARRGFGDADDPTVFGDNDFRFYGVAFLLAGIPATLFSARSFYRLFRAVYDQGLGLPSTDPDCALDPQNQRSQRLDPLQGPADGRLVGLIQAGHEVLRDGASVQDQKDKQVILKSAHTPRTPGTVLRSHDALSPMRSKTFSQLLECISVNARQGAKLSFGNKPRAVKL